MSLLAAPRMVEDVAPALGVASNAVNPAVAALLLILYFFKARRIKQRRWSKGVGPAHLQPRDAAAGFTEFCAILEGELLLRPGHCTAPIARPAAVQTQHRAGGAEAAHRDPPPVQSRQQRPLGTSKKFWRQLQLWGGCRTHHGIKAAIQNPGPSVEVGLAIASWHQGKAVIDAIPI